MPKTRGESIFFTAITAWMMVYVMTLYNTVLARGNFTNATFLIALYYFYNFCNTDIHRNLASWICQRAWCISWVWLY